MISIKHRYVAHYLYTSSSGYLKLYGVEIEGGRLARIFPFTEEAENVAWLPGVIKLEMTSEYGLEIWQYYTLYFTKMMPVSGTRLKTLLSLSPH